MSLQIGHTRRDVLATFCGASMSCAFIQATVTSAHLTAANENYEYVYLALHTLPLPSPYELASCAALESQIIQMKAELSRISGGGLAIGQELRRKFEQSRSTLQKAIRDSTSALESSKIDSVAANISAGVGVLLTVVGAVLEAPLAVGTTAALEIMSGPTIFGWQLYKRKQADNTEIMIGYARDRAFMYGSLAAEKAASTPGRLVGSSLKTISLLSSFVDALAANEDKQRLLDDGKRMRDELAQLDKFVDGLGTNNAAWANCYRNVLQGAVQNLTQFIQATRTKGCTVQGPTIIKPL